jgi:hypothetical protein
MGEPAWISSFCSVLGGATYWLHLRDFLAWGVSTGSPTAMRKKGPLIASRARCHCHRCINHLTLALSSICFSCHLCLFPHSRHSRHAFRVVYRCVRRSVFPVRIPFRGLR